MTKKTEDFGDLIPDIGELAAENIPDGTFVVYEDIVNEKMIIKSAEEAYGDFGLYYKVTLHRHNSQNELFMNVGASQPVQTLQAAIEKAQIPCRAKFVKQGRAWLLVGWNYVPKR